jgi:hypothetical protein
MATRLERSQSFLELDLISQRDVMITHLRNLRLQPHTAVVDRSRVEGRESKAPSLIEAKRIDVVVSGDEPQPRAAEVSRQPLDGLNESGASPEPLLCGVKREDLALVLGHDVGEDAREPSLIFGKQRRMFDRMQEFATPRNAGRFMLFVERKDVGTIHRLLGANSHRGGKRATVESSPPARLAELAPARFPD